MTEFSWVPPSRRIPVWAVNPTLLQPPSPAIIPPHTTPACRSGRSCSRYVCYAVKSDRIHVIGPMAELTRVQRAVAPIAATLLAGGMALYPKQTAFAEDPREVRTTDTFNLLCDI